MIGILGNPGRITEMKEDSSVSLFKSIPKFNCVNWTEYFNTLLHILVKESKLEAAHRIFLGNS
uniref:Uncharacterized protein n=1 Tax=Populus trichocarpa TaxID=3694 RepID=A0A2K1XTH7_POPTR